MQSQVCKIAPTDVRERWKHLKGVIFNRKHVSVSARFVYLRTKTVYWKSVWYTLVQRGRRKTTVIHRNLLSALSSTMLHSRPYCHFVIGLLTVTVQSHMLATILLKQTVNRCWHKLACFSTAYAVVFHRKRLVKTRLYAKRKHISDWTLRLYNNYLQQAA